MGLELFKIDTSTPHPGITVIGEIASRETNGGWVTLKSTKPLSRENHQWGIKILDQGEGNDGSGLMIGLLPKLSSPTAIANMGSKYLSELGGWCLSRAGESYGSWKCDCKIPFVSGQVVEFDFDFSTKSIFIMSGKESATGHIPYITEADELYPAFSMYYLNQKVMFV